jgi:hypothetical protein
MPNITSFAYSGIMGRKCTQDVGKQEFLLSSCSGNRTRGVAVDGLRSDQLPLAPSVPPPSRNQRRKAQSHSLPLWHQERSRTGKTRGPSCWHNLMRNDKIENDQVRVGLCSRCKHAKVVESDRGSDFYLRQLSMTDPRFPKYLCLPIRDQLFKYGLTNLLNS